MKTKMLYIMFIVITPLLYPQQVLKTELPTISNSRLLCAVTKDNASGYFCFSYTLVNGAGNTGKIGTFKIDVTRSPGSIDIDTVGLRFFNKYDNWIESTNRRAYQKWYGKITPVGFPMMPNQYWDGDLNNNYKLAWFATDTLELQPDDTLRDFVMMSKGLPGLRYCRIEPTFFSGQYVLSEEEDTLKNTVLPKIHRGNIDSVEESLAVNLMVVGPISPPIFFDPTVWCDTLANYTTQSRSLGWIKDQATTDKYLGYFVSAKTKLVQHDSVGARTVLLQVLHDVNIDSTSNISSEAYALLRFNTEYIVNILPQAQVAPFFAIKLVSSTGTKLNGGSLHYYEGSWKDAINNQDGTFSIDTKLKTLSLRMTYEYGTQTKSNVSISNDTIVFQTVNVQLQLQNSGGVLMDTGSVQYYAGAWRTLGVTANGTALKELLPANYSFRMTYAYASKDKQQDIGTNATVVFQTVNAAVQLQNSQGVLMDQGTVQYYAGAWRSLGSTINGIASKELLPNNYSFRMTYAYASKDKQQDLSINPTVVFQTVNATVQLQNSQSALIDQGTVQYYSGAWRTFGTTNNGTASKELLPSNYSFRMSYAFASKDKQQDISTNATVVFQTVNAAVQLQNSQGDLIDQGTVQYYSGAWRALGTTTNGTVTKDLLPNTYSFRMTYEYVSLDKAQDVTTNNTVSFSTVLCTIRVKNSQNQLVDNAMASYYSGAWRVIGNTVNGDVMKELLPVNLSFRVKYGTQQQDKQQNLSTNNLVEFGIQ